MKILRILNLILPILIISCSNDYKPSIENSSDDMHQQKSSVELNTDHTKEKKIILEEKPHEKVNNYSKSSMENNFLDDVYQEVVTDSIRQYEITKKHGELVDRCVQAGMVVAAQLQAQNESEYKQWKRIEKFECDNYENEEMKEFESESY